DDAVKSIRIIVEAIVAAVQSGLSQRDSRRAARGAADVKSAAAASAGIGAEQPAVASDEIDLSKVELPPDVVPLVEGEAEVVAPKKITRPKRAVVKAE
ncbi:MAG TPA: 30S ribosomal protein S2, partial [Opitutus sp.]|nr:30S ribosomal protein S2 [Opitutus sp.]